MRKAAMGHVCRGLASTQNEVIILDKQQLYHKVKYRIVSI